MIKVVLKIPEDEINNTLSKLVKIGITDIKVKQKEKNPNLFRFKNVYPSKNK